MSTQFPTWTPKPKLDRDIQLILHAVRRAKQRYGIDLTHDKLVAITNQIIRKQSLYLGKRSKGTEIHVVTLEDKELPVYWSPGLKTIATILPPEAMERLQELYDAAMAAKAEPPSVQLEIEAQQKKAKARLEQMSREHKSHKDIKKLASQYRKQSLGYSTITEAQKRLETGQLFDQQHPDKAIVLNNYDEAIRQIRDGDSFLIEALSSMRSIHEICINDQVFAVLYRKSKKDIPQVLTDEDRFNIRERFPDLPSYWQHLKEREEYQALFNQIGFCSTCGSEGPMGKYCLNCHTRFE